ncbi:MULTISPECIES: hypothetical protein [unclassified Arthrobacter]|uniref:hypothetical protein n=1 Tax=unclassified Arthrobacter TaxID=235627 RepID=UPI002157FD2F
MRHFATQSGRRKGQFGCQIKIKKTSSIGRSRSSHHELSRQGTGQLSLTPMKRGSLRRMSANRL